MGYLNGSISRSQVISASRTGYYTTINCDAAAKTLSLTPGKLLHGIVVRFPADAVLRVGTSVNGQEILPDENIAANVPATFTFGIPLSAIANTVIYFGGCAIGGTIDVFSF